MSSRRDNARFDDAFSRFAAELPGDFTWSVKFEGDDEWDIALGDGRMFRITPNGWCELATSDAADREDAARLLLAELAVEIDRQDEKHGPYGSQGGTRLGVSRLALASLEDEAAEALAAWRDERSIIQLGDVPTQTRDEVLQVAAVCIRALRDAL